MKKLVSLVGVFLIIGASSFTGKDFEKGFADGYCAGWKDVRGSLTICPITPIAPIPDVGEDDYKGGFSVGFKKGYKDAK